ncbi:hypothetical protein E2C01_093956 [Portunus trituberculatus]|uniref:Uncharacterized protein n=1 Tax=Portunus trituberculatus TaxID=210409 RepID=A0A5B7JR82_PORTR|nr:hypothetical protein [Portunus trituberculatus]
MATAGRNRKIVHRLVHREVEFLVTDRLKETMCSLPIVEGTKGPFHGTLPYCIPNSHLGLSISWSVPTEDWVL